MDPAAFVAMMGDRALEDKAHEAESSEAIPSVPVQAPVLSRVIILHNAFSPKLLVPNPYLQQADAGPRTSFPEVEREYLNMCCQFGYVRYTQVHSILRSTMNDISVPMVCSYRQASANDGVCSVKIGFATKEGAKA